MSSLLEKIRSRGYWHIVIRPTIWVPDRFTDISTLLPLIKRIRVSLRSWDYPHVDEQVLPIIDIDWIGQEVEWEFVLETWRLFQSGQFVHLLSIHEDWRDQSSWWRPQPDWQPGRHLDVLDTLFSYTEIFEFASRLALATDGDDPFHIQVTLDGLRDRRLRSEEFPTSLHLRTSSASKLTKFPFAIDIPRTELIATPREFAVRAARELFLRFNWDPSDDYLRSKQATLRR